MAILGHIEIQQMLPVKYDSTGTSCSNELPFFIMFILLLVQHERDDHISESYAIQENIANCMALEILEIVGDK